MSAEVYGLDPVDTGKAEEFGESLSVPQQFEQPEVPEVVVSGRSLEEEILAGEPEDMEIGKPEEDMTAAQTAAMQAKAMLKIAESMSGFMQNQERTKQKSYLDILPDSPFNPEGKRSRTPLRGSIFQHGMMVNPMMLTEEEIVLANQLKPGRYVNRTVEVSRTSNGDLNITWPNKRIDQRMEFNSKFPNFPTLCRVLVAERLEKEAKRRAGHFESEEIL